MSAPVPPHRRANFVLVLVAVQDSLESEPLYPGPVVKARGDRGVDVGLVPLPRHRLAVESLMGSEACRSN